MGRNRFESPCATSDCGVRVEPGVGVLHKGCKGWEVYCADHSHRYSRNPFDENGEQLAIDPLVLFLREVLQWEYDCSSGEGSHWRHSPSGSGRVVNEIDEVVAQGMRHVAEHLQLWDPVHTHSNVESRRLVVDLYEDASEGSPEKAALHMALQALAMPYEDFLGYREEWTLPARTK